MKKEENKRPAEGLVNFAQVGVDKTAKKASGEVSDKDVERANEILSPDQESMESRG